MDTKAGKIRGDKDTGVTGKSWAHVIAPTQDSQSPVIQSRDRGGCRSGRSTPYHQGSIHPFVVSPLLPQPWLSHGEKEIRQTTPPSCLSVQLLSPCIRPAPVPETFLGVGSQKLIDMGKIQFSVPHFTTSSCLKILSTLPHATYVTIFGFYQAPGGPCQRMVHHPHSCPRQKHESLSTTSLFLVNTSLSPVNVTP